MPTVIAFLDHSARISKIVLDAKRQQNHITSNIKQKQTLNPLVASFESLFLLRNNYIRWFVTYLDCCFFTCKKFLETMRHTRNTHRHLSHTNTPRSGKTTDWLDTVCHSLPDNFEYIYTETLYHRTTLRSQNDFQTKQSKLYWYPRLNSRLIPICFSLNTKPSLIIKMITEYKKKTWTSKFNFVTFALPLVSIALSPIFY